MLNCWAGLLFSLSLALSSVPPIHAADRLGVVLMHGKGASPTQLNEMAAALTAEGHVVDGPEMCWSRRRMYDRVYPDCLTDADAAAGRLKAGGATAVVVAGMSLGGNAALAYGARREGLKGVIALAPAPPFEFISRQPDIAKSLREAHIQIAAGRGDQAAAFADVSLGRTFEVETTANIYVSFFGENTSGIMPDNAAGLKAPLLIVSGINDPSQRSIPYVFARAPATRVNWHVTVPSDHLNTPAAAREIVLVWLKLLAER
jgi:esterase/lipase